MTTARDLQDLHRITRARYNQRQQGFAKVLAEETHLRSELARLDDMHRDAQTTDPTPMRAIGADIMWQGWVGRARTDLNLRLARVLSVKERHLLEVRRAYGKVLVVEELQSRMQQQHRKTRDDASLAQAISVALHP
jgi:hypothetical protein